MTARRVLFICAFALPWVLLVALLVFTLRQISRPPGVASNDAPAGVTPNQSGVSGAKAGSGNVASTSIYAHNLLLRKGPTFRVYVRWLSGELVRTRRNENPSFDDIESFYLYIKTGVLRANLGDIGTFLNQGGLAGSLLSNVTLRGDGDQIKLTGTLHKILPLPIEVDGSIGALPDGRIRVRVTSLKALKIPLKGLLRTFHITLADLVHPQGVAGIEINGSDILLNTQTLLPPPHIRGQLSIVHVVNPDLELVYGDAAKEVSQVEQWRNFLRLSGGTLDFGKLTMHHVDLVMIDISKDPWFDLDLEHYQTQLVNGTTRMTPQAGLQLFIPDLRDIPVNKQAHDIGIEWMKNRNLEPPPDVRPHK